MLFLNNFAEPLCKQVHDTLVSLYKCLLIKKKVPLPQIVGVEDEAQMKIIRKHIVLTTCAMFYNHERAVIDFFQSYHPHFEYFLLMVHELLPTDITRYGLNGHFSTYEAKLLVCGLSKAIFRKDWELLPFGTEEAYQAELRDSAIRISNTLYWLKL